MDKMAKSPFVSTPHQVSFGPRTSSQAFGGSSPHGNGSSSFRFPVITCISAGQSHSAFLTCDGDAFLCGSNDNNELGLGTAAPIVMVPTRVKYTKERFRQVEAGSHFTLFLTSTGTIYSAGLNTNCQLGIGEAGSSSSTRLPTKIPGLTDMTFKEVSCWNWSAALTTDGELFVWGPTPSGVIKSPKRLSNEKTRFSQVQIKGNHGIALESSGLVWAWGKNDAGQLGTGDAYERKVPNPVLKLQGRRVHGVFCGEAFSIGLGSEIGEKLIDPSHPVQDATEEQFERTRSKEGNRFFFKEKTGPESRTNHFLHEKSKENESMENEDSVWDEKEARKSRSNSVYEKYLEKQKSSLTDEIKKERKNNKELQAVIKDLKKKLKM